MRRNADEEAIMSDVGPLDRHYAYPLVTWGSTLLGAVVAVVTAFMLNVLGAALGVAAVAVVQTTQSAAISGVIGMIWVALANLVALGFGAWVAGRSTANPDHHGGTLQGIAVWAVTSVAVLFIAGSALSGLSHAAMQTTGLATAGANSSTSDATPGQMGGMMTGPSPATSSPATTPSPATTQGDAATQQQDAAALQSAATKTAAATASAAFGTFLAMVLGLVAAIFGARYGARHPGWTERPRYTYVERRHPGSPTL